MKIKYFLILILIFVIQIFPQRVKVTDYQVPISKARTLRFDGAWNWSQTGNDVTANNANGNILYRTFYSSLPLAWFLDINATGGKNFGDYTHNTLIDASFRKYIWNTMNWFAYSRVTAQYADYYKQIASDITLGFGYGRYINATALAKAVRIEQHLLKDKVISQYLPREAMIRIANIIERESEYRDIYGVTYETHWFDDIEKEIKKVDPLAENGIGSVGILRMRQVLFSINERVNERYYGWDLSIGFLFPISTYDKSPTGDPNLTINGRYSIPLNWRTQINTIGEAFTPLDSLFFKQYRARAGLDFIYEFSNRINFVSSYRFGLVKYPNTKTELENNLSASFWFYLENKIYLTLNSSYIKQGGNPKIITTRIGLQYNLY